jgi:hypothetical protein
MSEDISSSESSVASTGWQDGPAWRFMVLCGGGEDPFRLRKRGPEEAAAFLPLLQLWT